MPEPTSVLIKAPLAVYGALANGLDKMIAVRDDQEALAALGDPEMHHNCGLCNETFENGALFLRHLGPCVVLRAPSGKLWIPGADLKGD